MWEDATHSQSISPDAKVYMEFRVRDSQGLLPPGVIFEARDTKAMRVGCDVHPSGCYTMTACIPCGPSYEGSSLSYNSATQSTRQLLWN